MLTLIWPDQTSSEITVCQISQNHRAIRNRLDDFVHQRVHSAGEFMPLPNKFPNFRPLIQFTFTRSANEFSQFRLEVLQIPPHFFDGFVDETLLTRECFQFRIEVPISKLRDTGNDLLLHTDMFGDNPIDTLRHRPVGSFQPADRNSYATFSQFVRIGHYNHLFNESTNVGSEQLDVIIDERLLPGKLLQCCVKIPVRKRCDAAHRFLVDRNMVAYHFINTQRHVLVCALKQSRINGHINIPGGVFLSHGAHR